MAVIAAAKPAKHRRKPMVDDDIIRGTSNGRYPDVRLQERIRKEERDKVGQELKEVTDRLNNVLAVLNRDGGHRQAEVGIEQAIEDGLEEYHSRGLALLDLRYTLQWYEERIRLFSDKTKSITYLEAVSTELILDGGKRARKVLSND